jgi:hypothetical protein
LRKSICSISIGLQRQQQFALPAQLVKKKCDFQAGDDDDVFLQLSYPLDPLVVLLDLLQHGHVLLLHFLEVLLHHLHLLVSYKAAICSRATSRSMSRCCWATSFLRSSLGAWLFILSSVLSGMSVCWRRCVKFGVIEVSGQKLRGLVVVSRQANAPSQPPLDANLMFKPSQTLSSDQSARMARSPPRLPPPDPPVGLVRSPLCSTF